MERVQLVMKKLQSLISDGSELIKSPEIALTELLRLRISLQLHLEKAKSFNPSEEISNIFFETQEQAETLLIEVQTLIELNNNTKSDSTTYTTKLPTLQLPKFNGNMIEFNEFWDKFESAIDSRPIKDVEKLSYLFSCLEGQALDVIKGISTTNNNYNIAIDLLKSRFGSKTKLVDAHYKALCNINRSTENGADCRFTFNSIQRHLRVLQSLGENTSNNHIRVLILEKFPEKVLYELNVLKGPDCSSTEALDGLERIITAMESACKPELTKKIDNNPGCSSEALHIQVTNKNKKPWIGRKEKPCQNFKPRSTYEGKGKRKLQVTTTKYDMKKRRKSCIFCNGNHYNDACNIVKNIEERRKKLGKKCFLCFKEGHFSKDCTFDIKCYHCKEKHNSALCCKKYDSLSTLSTLPNNETYSFGINSKSLLQTATVTVRGQHNKTRKCRLLLDSGSQKSYITSKAATNLNLNLNKVDKLMIFTFGSDTPSETLSPVTEIEILTRRNVKKILQVNVVPYITNKISVPNVDTQINVDILADDGSTEEIDILIGNDYYFSFFSSEMIKLKENLYLINTDFGWISSGLLETNKEEENILTVITFYQCHRPDYPYFNEPDLPLRSIDVKFLWSLEGIGITDNPKASRDDEAVEYFNKTVKFENGRYQVKWPWIQYPPELPTNFGMAFGRLKGLLKRLDKSTIKEYDSILKEQKEAQIIEEIEKPKNLYEQTTPPIHYLPHHMVKTEGKRGRLVYDASAKTKEEKSLNECLFRGPSMLEDLTSLLIAFRTHKIGITADVEKAFLQIGLQEEDREVTRFLWLKDITKEPSEDNLIHLRFTRVPFGLVSSPFLLTASIRHHMSQRGGSLLKEIADKCYVDNLITGAQSKTEAIELYNQTHNVFSELSMNIREWTSNDKDFLQNIPEQKRAKDEKEVKILGLIWNLQHDMLQLKYKENLENETPVTRKEVLKTLARIYDPCGFVAPLVLSAKLLFQKLCHMKLKWDEKIPEDLTQKWEEIKQSFKVIQSIEVPRYIGLEDRNTSKLELHCFADASKDAYAAVIYLRIEDRNQIKTAFVMAKSRMTPIEEKDALKIPKLELLGCLIGCRLLKYVRDSLALQIEKEYLWTDSLIVLNWLQSNKLLPPFVARRIEEIKKHKQIQPYYVNTSENPADLATRPDLWLMKKEVWFNGPTFLRQTITNWPETRFLDYHRSLLVAGEGHDAHDPEETRIDDSEERIVDEHHEETPGDLDVVMEEQKKPESEQMAEIRRLQIEHYPEEMKGKETHLTRNLGLFLDIDGILRCKGRMSNTCWTYDMKHPILLPKDCQFTNDLIMSIHEKNYHVGSAHTLSLIRQQYWIPQGRSQVKKIIKKCLQCQKHTNGPYKLPAPPALPSERVNYSSPFTYTGVDYLGPIFVNTEKDKAKRWICLFTCLAVRAVHLEVVRDLTAEECLMALRRFISCRGLPRKIVSDNGTQFRLTAEVLTNSYCIENKIAWRFIPQLAPWHGGFYERLVGVVKNCLKKTLQKQWLNDTQLETVVKEVEAVVNTRPLTNVGSELETVLRPSDFLSMGNCLTTDMNDMNLNQDGSSTKRSLVEGWRRGQIILEEFKKMFVNQYLMSLRERYNVSHKQPRITSSSLPCIGDVVQIKGEQKNRTNWKIGRIIELITGSDNQCRVAKVKTDSGIYTRSIAHLYPLEIDAIVSTNEEADISTEKNITENVPPVVHLPENVAGKNLPNAENIETIDNQNKEQSEQNLTDLPTTEHKLTETEQNLLESEPEQNPLLTELEQNSLETESEQNLLETEHDQPENQNEPETAAPRLEENRVRRDAAVRAREKIAEWTRHLVALL